MIGKASFVAALGCVAFVSAVGCSSAPTESTSGDQQAVLHTTDPGGGGGGGDPDPPRYVCPARPTLTDTDCRNHVQGFAIPKPSGTACPTINVATYNATWYPAADVDYQVVEPPLGPSICAYPYGSLISNATRAPINPSLASPAAWAAYGCNVRATQISYIIPTDPQTFTFTNPVTGVAINFPLAIYDQVCPDGVRGCGTCVR